MSGRPRSSTTSSGCVVEHGDLGVATGGHPTRRVTGPFEGADQWPGDRCIVFDQEQLCHPPTLPVLNARI